MELFLALSFCTGTGDDGVSLLPLGLSSPSWTTPSVIEVLMDEFLDG